MVAALPERTRSILPVGRHSEGNLPMDELHKAYHALGLEPGAPFETVKRRYRRLALVWHPDRMTSAEAKREAEEELKKINNNFDKLKKHFESEHKPGPSCRCQPAAAGPPPPNNSQNKSGNQNTGAKSSGQSDAARKRQEDEATKKRTEERRRREQEEAAAQRAAEAAQKAREKQQGAEDAMKYEAARKEEVLRWKCAAGVAITFIVLIAYCWVGCAARDLVHWTGKQWEDFQEQFKPKPPASTEPPSYTRDLQPYIPPYQQFPGGNPTSWLQFHDE